MTALDEYTKALKSWIDEWGMFYERKEIIETFVEEHQLPKDITIEELFEFCRKNAD